MEKKENNEKLYSFKEVADQLGITEQEFIQIAKDEGLIDESGRPTLKAIHNGFLVTYPDELN